MIEVSHLRYAWPGNAADLLNIDSLRIASGQRVFLQGPSGSGKSTLLGLLAGVLTPASGTVRVLGTEVSRLSGPARDRFRADHVGLIFQQFNLLPYLSATDNVCLPCSFSPHRRSAATREHGSPAAAAASLLTQMGLPPDTWPKAAAQLSVGQQQRVAAARALIGQPELLIADEPTSALDSERREEFIHVLMKACDADGNSTPKTLVFVSHDERLAHHFDTHISLTHLTKTAEREHP